MPWFVDLLYRPIKINLLGNSHSGGPASPHALTSRVPESEQPRCGSGIRRAEGEEGWGLTCISSSCDWISGGKSAAPQVKGSNGSAPKRSLPTTTIAWSGGRTLVASRQRLFVIFVIFSQISGIYQTFLNTQYENYLQKSLFLGIHIHRKTHKDVRSLGTNHREGIEATYLLTYVWW